MATVIFQLGAKGRAVIPAAVRAEAHVDVGQTLIAHAEGVGRIVLETPEAIQSRVWAAAPAEGATNSATADIRRLRDEDTAQADRAATRRSAAGRRVKGDDSGAALLRALGL